MIAALYAMRNDHAFGLFDPATFSASGALPWGSVPEELENFYQILDQFEAVLVGHNTYTTAPPRLKKILSKKPIVYIVGSRAPTLITETSQNMRFLTQVGSSIREFCSEIDTVCIGGKALLETLADQGALDAIYRSTITPKAGTIPSLDNIIYLDHPLLSGTPPHAVVSYVASGENERYRFVTEGIYL